jgi:DNA invertase Pin-like site-specific DNA recombinase
MICDYTRFSTDRQSIEPQASRPAAAGCEKAIRKVLSRAKTDRAQFRLAPDPLGPGNILSVTRLDRLARPTRDLLNMLPAISGNGAGFRSLADVLTDTTTPRGGLTATGRGGLAEFERDLIRARTGEGRARANARAVTLRREAPLSCHQRSRISRLSEVPHG